MYNANINSISAISWREQISKHNKNEGIKFSAYATFLE